MKDEFWGTFGFISANFRLSVDHNTRSALSPFDLQFTSNKFKILRNEFTESSISLWLSKQKTQKKLPYRFAIREFFFILLPKRQN